MAHSDSAPLLLSASIDAKMSTTLCRRTRSVTQNSHDTSASTKLGSCQDGMSDASFSDREDFSDEEDFMESKFYGIHFRGDDIDLEPCEFIDDGEMQAKDGSSIAKAILEGKHTESRPLLTGVLGRQDKHLLSEQVWDPAQWQVAIED